MAAGRAKGEVRPPGPFETGGGTVASFDLEDIEGLRQVRRPEHDRILASKEEIDVLDVVIHSPAGAPGDHRNVLLEAAEIIVAASDTEGDSSGVVVPQRGLHAEREPVPAGSGAK